MSTLLDRALSEFAKGFQLLCLLISLFIGFSSNSTAEDKAELRERKIFIEKANKEHLEQVRKSAAEMEKRGIQALLRITRLKPFGDWDFIMSTAEISTGNQILVRISKKLQCLSVL